jgi:hypothetical protein
MILDLIGSAGIRTNRVMMISGLALGTVPNGNIGQGITFNISRRFEKGLPIKVIKMGIKVPSSSIKYGCLNMMMETKQVCSRLLSD